MDIKKILKFTRNYRGLFDERISTWLYNKFIKNKFLSGITWFNEESISINFTSTEYIERRVWMLGEYETEIKKVFETYVPFDGIVLDIGANIGINTIRLSNCVGSRGRVYSFEPIPFNQQRFAKNIKLNKIENARLEPFALGSNNESILIKYNESEENMGAISLREKSDSGLLITVKKGDDWVQEHNISSIDFMKIDVEGYEWEVISGFENTINKFHPGILVEWDLNYMKQNGVSLFEWQKFIDKYNYKVYQVNKYELVQIEFIKEAKDGNLLLI